MSKNFERDLQAMSVTIPDVPEKKLRA